MTQTQRDVERAVRSLLCDNRTIGAQDLANATYRSRSAAWYHLRRLYRHGKLKRVLIGDTGTRGRYTLP